MSTRSTLGAAGIAVALGVVWAASSLSAQERLPWLKQSEPQSQDDDEGTYRERPVQREPAYVPPSASPGGYANRGGNDAYSPPRPGGYAGTAPSYPAGQSAYGQPYPAPPDAEPYERRSGNRREPAPRYGSAYPTERDYGPGPRRYQQEEPQEGSFSAGEIKSAGHRFFGSISEGVASVIEYAFKTQGRPNGYILGEDAGGAFIAGLRYGEGTLHTKDAGSHKVYWQGPSLGYDAGFEGSKVMVLVYNLRDPGEIYDRFGGVAGSAYVIGGVGLTFQTKDHIVLAPIRAGVGLRLGANVGYLKYTPRPTWNPF